MRLHTVTITAFGPFAGSEVVDFDRLHDAGLFLLHGPTGAGKTSILDAVGFALYGTVPGPRQTARRLRSDHASLDRPTEVVLEATLRGRRLRITRRPEQLRPRKRGTGTTKEQASVLVEERSESGWKTLSTRLDEAGLLLADEIGMSADQFFQVALLPQGQFARFLHSNADERMTVLQRLFDTSRFARARDWLENLRRREAQIVGQRRAAVNEVLARASQATGLSTVDLDEVRQDDPEGWLADHLTRAQEDEARHARTAREARVTVRRCAEELTQARELEQRQKRLRSLWERQARQEAEAPAVAAVSEALAQHDRALAVRPSVNVRDDARRRLCDMDALRDDAFRALSDHGYAAALVPDDLEQLASQTRERAGGLAALASTEAGLPGRQHDIERLRAQITDLDRQHRQLEEEIAALPEHRSRIETELAAAEAATARLDGERRAVTELERRHAAAGELSSLQAKVVAAVRAVQRATSQHLDAKERHLALRAEWLAGTVAALAASLEENQPCPVCGSSVHPDPAKPDATTAVTRAELDDAAAREDHFEATRRDVEQQLADARTALAEGRVRAGGHERDADGLVATLMQDLAAARTTLTQTESLVATLQDLQRAQAELEARVTQLTADRDRAALERTRLVAERGQAETLFERDTALVRDGREDAPSVAERRVQLLALAAAADAARTARVQHRAITVECQDAAKNADSAARRAGFPDADAADRALLSEADHLEATRMVTAAAEERARIAEALEDPALAGVPGDADPDTASAAERHEHAEAEARRQQAAHATAAHRSEQLARLQDALGAALAELGPAEERAAAVRALADLTAGNGANRLRMTLEAFVLAARLEQVAEAASVRLTKMSAGRYSLRHSDERRGRGRSGLGLTVFDTWTGQERDTATLSGGETFQASLALALGLADVVQAESGGLSIDTLFIDEGFGSLDPDTLERVMDTLDGLREGGRVVGVVSHVSDLQQRINARVRVVQGKDGSEVEQVA